MMHTDHVTTSTRQLYDANIEFSLRRSRNYGNFWTFFEFSALCMKNSIFRSTRSTILEFALNQSPKTGTKSAVVLVSPNAPSKVKLA